MTKAQHQAWSQTHVDEYLRGLRILPFKESETDLLAAYLAENLACLLHQQGAEEPLLYLNLHERTSSVLAKVTSGVSHYLFRQQAIRITADQGNADLILGGRLNPVDRRLHQLWLTARPANSTQTVPGIDTDGYIVLSSPARTSEHATPGHQDAGRASSRALANSALISELRIKQPRDPSHCNILDPGTHDERFIAIDGAIRAGQCFGLEFDLYRDARVYLLNPRIDGALVRLMPTSCRPRRSTHSYWLAGTTVWVPYERDSTDQFDESLGQSPLESFYAIALTQSNSDRELEKHLQRLPEACDGNLLAGLDTHELDNWLSQLDTLVSRLGKQVEWRGLRVRRER